MVRLITIIFIVFFFACNQPNREQVQKIEIGWNEVETERVLGEPILKIPDEGGSIWIYYYPHKSYNKRMDIYFRENEVSEVVIY